MSLREMQLALSANTRLRLQKAPPMAGFCKLPIGLRAPKLAAAGTKSPIVSGGYLKYTRFRETATGDWVLRNCVADAAVRLGVRSTHQPIARSLDDTIKRLETSRNPCQAP